MKNAKLVAWGMIISLSIAFLTMLEAFDATTGYGIAGIGMWVFGIWASIILLKNRPDAEK